MSPLGDLETEHQKLAVDSRRIPIEDFPYSSAG
jgi:hypothetical protein